MDGSDDWVYLDTETTGLDPTWDEILDVAVAGPAGEPLLDTLVRPVRNRRWDEAQSIHHITPEMVEDAPTFNEVMPTLREIVADRRVVIYNAFFDTAMMGRSALDTAADIQCAMLAWAEHVGVINPRYGSYKWHKLVIAAAAVGHIWTGTPHRAMADALACRSVWRHLQGYWD